MTLIATGNEGLGRLLPGRRKPVHGRLDYFDACDGSGLSTCWKLETPTLPISRRRMTPFPLHWYASSGTSSRGRRKGAVFSSHPQPLAVIPGSSSPVGFAGRFFVGGGAVGFAAAVAVACRASDRRFSISSTMPDRDDRPATGTLLSKSSANDNDAAAQSLILWNYQQVGLVEKRSTSPNYQAPPEIDGNSKGPDS